MSTCRACLQDKADEYCSLLNKIRDVPLYSMYESLTGLSVSPEDGLSNCVCQDCADLIVTCNNFRMKCLKSDAQFRSLLSKVRSIEVEPPLPVEESDHPAADADQPTRIELYFEENECIVPAKVDWSKVNAQQLTIYAAEHDDIDWADYEETEYELYDVTEEEKMVEKVVTAESENGGPCEIVLESADILEKPQESVDEIEQPASTDDPTPPSIVCCCGCTTIIHSGTMEELRQHSVDVHKKDSKPNSLRPYECNICYRRYSQSVHLLKHKATIYQPMKMYECKHCNANFKSRTALYNHNLSKHLRKRTYVCNVCQKGFYTSSTLISHRQTHDKKKFQCDKCSKMFTRFSDLVTHQTYHSNERPYGCSECEMRFKSLANLRGHQTVHTGERSKLCRICGKGFLTYSDRRVHELEHANIYPFQCNFCDKKYGRNYKLQMHIRKVHTGERPFACSDCSKTFIQRWELKSHRRVVHGAMDESVDT